MELNEGLIAIEWIPLLFYSVMVVVPIVVVIWGIISIRNLKKRVAEIERQIDDIKGLPYCGRQRPGGVCDSKPQGRTSEKP